MLAFESIYRFYFWISVRRVKKKKERNEVEMDRLELTTESHSQLEFIIEHTAGKWILARPTI